MVRSFTPYRLVNWLEDQVVEYLKAHPKVKKFKLHNFRGTAMSRARMAGVSYDDAAVAFGCNPQTMRQHYIALDEVEISDRVMEKIQNGIEGELREMGNRGSQQKRTCDPSSQVLYLKQLLKCGKQDLNLHGLAATRPST